MKPPLTIDPEMTVDEIMRRWPATIRVFIRNRMLCIGCPIGVFHTVKDACDAHRIDEDTFSAELLAAMETDDLAGGPSAFESPSVLGFPEQDKPPPSDRLTSCDGSRPRP